MTFPAEWLRPDWPAPPRVRAFVTTRAGGVSEGDFASMNLGLASGDEPGRVARNREIVRAHLPSDPRWLAQVHGTQVAHLDHLAEREVPTADAAVTATPGTVCVVLTADCLPLLLCDRAGQNVGTVHAGWRGMAAGVIENAVAAMGSPAHEIVAWMGPAIGPRSFEVGPEVRAAFMAVEPAAESAFAPRGDGKFLADLYALARRRLARAGVAQVHGGGGCTLLERERFFSYRRQPKSGRMGAFAWIE
jgi:hypothetical protein